jgi:hypothetical protein
LATAAAEVSGANQYKVKPLALVSTVAPITFALFSIVPDAAACEAGALEAAELPEPEEPPHAATTRAAAACPAGASNLIRMACLPLYGSDLIPDT